jgi:hypothetical protein
MTQSDDDQNGEEQIFQRFLTVAGGDIGQYELARHHGNQDGATKALHELRRHAKEARDEWLRIEIYYQEERRRSPAHSVHPDQDLPTAVRQFLNILKNELGQGSLHGAGAAVLKIQELVAKVLGPDDCEDQQTGHATDASSSALPA